MTFESTVVVVSTVDQNVRFVLNRMTFGRRIELMRRVRQLSARLEFEKAGSAVTDQLQAGLLAAEIDELYLRWGLKAIEGLHLDGHVATPETLIMSGPEALCREIITAIKRECILNEEERKN